LLGSPEVSEIDNPYFPGSAILAVASHLLAAKVAQVQGDHALMIDQFEQAVAAETALPYMEPAFWSLPTRHTYGAALLQTGNPAEAERVFREDLALYPRNGWALFGLEQALRAQGRNEAAASVHRELQEAWKHADIQLDLAWY
jgi:tetratricopeptide (TPR) repeat protein